MEIELIPPMDEVSSVWDKEVPIVREGRTWHCYITSNISNPDTYNELCYLLDNAYPCDQINLHINTPGGVIDSAFKIIYSLNNTNAQTTAILTGTVASAGTMIALSCHDIEIAPFTQFMVHNYSGGTAGKGHEVRDYVKFSDKQLNKAFSTIYKDFLTTQEMHDVIEGKDMWMDDEEVMERWRAMKGQQCSISA